MFGLGFIGKKIFGTVNDRLLKKEQKKVQLINALEEEVSKLSDEDLKKRTAWFKDRLAKGENLDDILVEAYATVREAGKRVLGERAHDVQLLGAIFLNNGYIAEMKTGEGKTLASIHTAYLNALSGKGVHIVTVNDYLAKRDANWVGKIAEFLGLSVDYIVHDKRDQDRKAAYAADITYGTNNEFGFDYLRDNMKFSVEDLVQRPFNFAIVDEVDSILIDEARTPLIISGASEDSSEMYRKINDIVPLLKEEHYKKDEKDKNVTLTEEGIEYAEKILHEKGIIESKNLYDISNAQIVHHLDKALTAHKLYEKDVDYLIRDDQVFIIDEFTGRVMEGRRYSDGLHQALEAKEEVSIQQENQTLASITYQNYFRLYPKLAGMTGTALTEAQEFSEIYRLNCIAIPTNKPLIRADHEDEIYKTAEEKFDAIAELIKECHDRKQPVLVGTISIEKSEYLAKLIQQKLKIKPQVLNAKYHEQEAYIIAQAGVPGAVTIATNMAGRGTDIQLGGNCDMRIEQELKNISDEDLKKRRAEEIKKDVLAKKEEVLEAGGLYIIGTERHESRRIDNQLRGRAGRQGDPGASKFFLSLEDDLMRIFGGERLNSFLNRFGFKEGENITHPWVSKAIERAQKKVEARNFDIRKSLLKFDDVMNDQRKVVYDKRNEILRSDDLHDEVEEIRHDLVRDIVYRNIPPKVFPEDWNLDAIEIAAFEHLGVELNAKPWAKEEGITEEKVLKRVIEASDKRMAEQEEKYGAKFMRIAERGLYLQTLDKSWKEHHLNLDHLRKGISLRAYGQKDPLNEYKKEAFNLFQDMLFRMGENLVTLLSKMEFDVEHADKLMPQRKKSAKVSLNAPKQFDRFGNMTSEGDIDEGKQGTVRYSDKDFDPNDPSTWGKVSRNDPCPCGSGKKFKHCHGKIE